MEEDGYCYGCQSCNTPIFYDHTCGHTICSVCGLILNSRSVHESHNDDVVHVINGPSSPTIPATNLGNSNGGGTLISCGSLTNHPHGSGPNSPKVQALGTTEEISYGSLTNHPHASDPNSPKVQALGATEEISDGSLTNHPHGSDPNSPTVQTLMAMEDMARKLGLVERTKNGAKELYKKVDDEKICGRQRNPRAIMAACLYLVCQQEGSPRTVREIYNVACDGVRKKEIHKCMEILKKWLNVTGTIHAKDIARRYCSNLGLNNSTLRAVQETVQKSESYDIRRNSTSIVAATIFMVTQLSEKRISIREVAQASKVTEATIKKAYKDLYHYASLLIPSWYANANAIESLIRLR